MAQPLKSLALILAVAAGLLSAGVAWANHGYGSSSHFSARHGYGWHRDGGWHHPYWGPGYYGTWPWFYPSWYFGYTVPLFPDTIEIEPAQAPQYIEQNPSANPPANVQPNVWYYCSNPQGYYPYVRSCSTSWQSVPAQPPQ